MGRFGGGGGGGGRGRSSSFSGSVSASTGNSQLSQEVAAATGFGRLCSWFKGGTSNYEHVDPLVKGGPRHCRILQEIYDEYLIAFGEEYCAFSDVTRRLVEYCGGVGVGAAKTAAASGAKPAAVESETKLSCDSSPWDECGLRHWELL